MKVSVVSFSYPRGIPEDTDDDYWGGFVFDCRSMPDPHDEVSLRGYSGLDTPVIDFFERYKDRVDRFLDAAESLIRQAIETAPETGRDYLQVAFGFPSAVVVFVDLHLCELVTVDFPNLHCISLTFFYRSPLEQLYIITF